MAKTNWAAGDSVTSTELNNLGVEVNGHGATVDQVDPILAKIGIRIVETATGVWSGDAPSRSPGFNPVEFVGWSDPADPTNGIVTPANIQNGDIWTESSVPA